MIYLEWVGAFLGVLGALLLSCNRAWSRYAWPVWIASNVFLIEFAANARAWGLFVMQVAFLAINIHGLRTWRMRRDHSAEVLR